jgi:hypothetical protein
MLWQVKGISCRRLQLYNQVKVLLEIIQKVREQVWLLRIRFRNQRISTGISPQSKVGHLNKRNSPNITRTRKKVNKMHFREIIKVSNRQIANMAQINAKIAIQESVLWKSSKTLKEAFQQKEEDTEIA